MREASPSGHEEETAKETGRSTCNSSVRSIYSHRLGHAFSVTKLDSLHLLVWPCMTGAYERHT